MENTKEKSNANRDQGRPLLSKAQGDQREGIGSGNLPEVDRPKPSNGKEVVPFKADEAPRGKAPIKPPRLRDAAVDRAMRDTNGNMVDAAVKLGVTIRDLDYAVRTSKQFDRIVQHIRRKARKNIHKYGRTSLEQVQESMARKLIIYRADALDSLHDLAVMPIGENSANNQIKFAAAVRLSQETSSVQVRDEMGTILQQLSHDFHANAPRLKTIRQTIREVTIETSEPESIDVTAEATLESSTVQSTSLLPHT